MIPVHSGEPETPRTEAGRDLAESMTHNATDDAIALGSPIPPERVLDLLAYHQSLVVAVEREAAAAPGAGLDVERLARALYLANAAGIPDTSEWRDRLREKADDLAAEYQRLGATPDPGPEPRKP